LNHSSARSPIPKTQLTVFLEIVVNIQHFRQSVKTRWLNYYVENRSWIANLRIWVDCDGHRRPSSSFILAALSVLEPNLNQLLPLIVDLSNNPDRVVAALGLNFNPEEHPAVIQRLQAETESAQLLEDIQSLKLLPASEAPAFQQRVVKPVAVKQATSDRRPEPQASPQASPQTTVSQAIQPPMQKSSQLITQQPVPREELSTKRPSQQPSSQPKAQARAQPKNTAKQALQQDETCTGENLDRRRSPKYR
jgi:hypothetical protein